MLICLMIVGFGSGATFLAALSTGLKSVPGYPGELLPLQSTSHESHRCFLPRFGYCDGWRVHESIACIDQRNRGMYVSYLLPSFVGSSSLNAEPVYKDVLDCAEDRCWPYYLRSLAVSTALFLFLPSFGLSLLPPDDPPPPCTITLVHYAAMPKLMGSLFSLKLLTKKNSCSVKKQFRCRPCPRYTSSQFNAALLSWNPQLSHLQAESVHQELKAAQFNEPISFVKSLHTLRNIFFWFLMLGTSLFMAT